MRVTHGIAELLVYVRVSVIDPDDGVAVPVVAVVVDVDVDAIHG